MPGLEHKLLALALSQRGLHQWLFSSPEASQLRGFGVWWNHLWFYLTPECFLAAANPFALWCSSHICCFIAKLNAWAWSFKCSGPLLSNLWGHGVWRQTHGMNFKPVLRTLSKKPEEGDQDNVLARSVKITAVTQCFIVQKEHLVEESLRSKHSLSRTCFHEATKKNKKTGTTKCNHFGNQQPILKRRINYLQPSEPLALLVNIFPGQLAPALSRLMPLSWPNDLVMGSVLVVSPARIVQVLPWPWSWLWSTICLLPAQPC